MMFARLLVLMATVAFAAAVPAKTLRWSSTGDIATQDPHAQDEGFTKSVNQMIYERLIMPGKDMSPTPWLATSWEVVSPTKRVFKLRRDVRFQDGTPFTADDVVFSFERAAKSKQFRTYTSQAGIPRKIDDYTVEFTTDPPNPIATIAIGEIPIMSRAWAQKNNSTEPQDFSTKEATYASRNAMGTGPFRLVSYEPGVKTVVAKNPAWWGIKDGRFEGNVDLLEYRPIAANATRMAALRSGEVDFVLDPPVQDIAGVRSDPSLRIIEGDEFRVITFTFDQARDQLLFSSVQGRNPFKDRRVRQALYQAIDVEAIRSTVMRGLATPTAIATPNPKGEGIRAEYEKRLPYDPAASKKLLAEAGYPNGFGFTLHCPNDRYVNDERICVAAAAMWARVGLDVKVDAMPKAIYFQRTPKKEFSACMQGWGDNNRDAMFTLKPLYHSLNEKGAGDTNYGNFRNAELDDLIDRAEVEMDREKRTALINQAIAVLQRDVNVIPIHRQVVPWATRANVRVLHRADNKFNPLWAWVD